jgi:transcriptional regulator, CarD family
VFTPGQTVVYPAQGVGVIERIETQELAGVQAEFYIVHILCNDINVLVPVKSAPNTGLRPLSSAKEAKKTMEELKNYQNTPVHAGQNWNRRQREYTERLKAGTLETVSSVLKELILLGAQKELSFGEKRLLEQSMALVSGELSYILEKPEEDIKETINSFYE